MGERGEYTVEFLPNATPLPIGRLHSWVIKLRTKSGEPFQPTQLAIMGGMPGHGHGLPSNPRVTREIGVGEYLVEGMLFSMSGEWRVVVGVVGPTGPDKIQINVAVTPGIAVPDTSSALWSTYELSTMQSLAVGGSERRLDPTNRFDGNDKAVTLGEALFFEKDLSATKTISCASCHIPSLKFTDNQKLSFGTAPTTRHAPSLLGVANGEWFYWDGRRDSLWSQALTPIENSAEMGGTRTAVVQYVLSNEEYRKPFLELIGQLNIAAIPKSAGPYGTAAERKAWQEMPAHQRKVINRTFAEIGKVLAAYVASLEPRASRFDQYVTNVIAGDSDTSDGPLSELELAGLRLFLDPAKTQCLRCHNGPYFTNFRFHNVGSASDDAGKTDYGRIVGLQAALIDEFNCMGNFSDAPNKDCEELRFAASDDLDAGAFKVPGLRNVAVTAPYFHDGRFATLTEIIEYYVDPPSREDVAHELPPLSLTANEIREIVAFLGALTGTATQSQIR
jgi:cytochrome c peroxidase